MVPMQATLRPTRRMEREMERDLTKEMAITTARWDGDKIELDWCTNLMREISWLRESLSELLRWTVYFPIYGWRKGVWATGALAFLCMYVCMYVRIARCVLLFLLLLYVIELKCFLNWLMVYLVPRNLYQRFCPFCAECIAPSGKHILNATISRTEALYGGKEPVNRQTSARSF